MQYKLHLSKKANEDALKPFLLKQETLLYHNTDIFFTNKRIIKLHTPKWAKIFHFFYTTFEDLHLDHLEGIKAKNVLNLKLFSSGLVVLLLGPIAQLIQLIGLEKLGAFIQNYIVLGLQAEGSIIISLILIFASLIIRDRFIEFHGHNTVIRARSFDDEELKKVRELQIVV